MNDSKQRRELSLDPAGRRQWSEFRELAHVMVDDMIDHLSTLAAQPAWRPMPGSRCVGSSSRADTPRGGRCGDRLTRTFSGWYCPTPVEISTLGSGAGSRATEHRSA